MRIVFLGTPSFAIEPLKRILDSHHEIVGVVCQPDKMGNRKKITQCDVKKFSLEHNLPLYQFEKISRDGVEVLKSLLPDVMVTAAYGQILSQEVLDVAPFGVINIHGSLLPQYRGASPVQHALLNGDSKTGVTIVKTVYELDAGDILLSKSLTISDNENAQELFDRLSVLGGDAIIEALSLIEQGKADYVPQDHTKATFTKKISKETEQIDWKKSNWQVHNLVRALNPNPTAWTTLKGKRLKIFKTIPVESADDYPVGSVIELTKKHFVVACGKGAVQVLELQEEGGKRLASAQYLCGNKIAQGDILE